MFYIWLAFCDALIYQVFIVVRKFFEQGTNSNPLRTSSPFVRVSIRVPSFLIVRKALKQIVIIDDTIRLVSWRYFVQGCSIFKMSNWTQLKIRTSTFAMFDSKLCSSGKFFFILALWGFLILWLQKARSIGRLFWYAFNNVSWCSTYLIPVGRLKWFGCMC